LSRLFSVWLVVALAMPIAASAASPPLAQTRLYTREAGGCARVQLDSLPQKVRLVLQQNAVDLAKVELCGPTRYPVFTVYFRFDPRAQTTRYFHPLYAKVAVANGFRPFSFVDLKDGVIVDVKIEDHGHLSIGYEDFTR
jgi:hypothetical protein